jgi:hypothetical protein
MSKTININFDATKLDKALMENGKYVKLTLIPLKEESVKAKQDGTPIQGDGWKLMKSHFVVQENKSKDVKMPIIGEGTYFSKEEKQDPIKFEDDIQIEKVPF